MNDLREVLRQHAAAVEDTHQHDRATVVHQRVRVVKRRRALTGAAVAVLVVGAVIGGLVLPQHHDVAPTNRPSRMVGHAVPKTTTSWGATYSYTKGYVGTGHLTVHLPKSDQDVLVRVASAKADGQLVVTDRSGAWVLPAGGFGTFRRVDPANGTVTVDVRGGTGQIALAVYTLSKTAAGYTRDGITFPNTVERRELLGAFIGDPGQDQGSVRLSRIDWTGPAPTMQVRPLCSGAPKGSMVSVDLGDGPVEVGCEAGAPEPQDAGHASGAVTFRAPGRQMTAIVTLVDRAGKPTPVPAGARIGAGIYGWSIPDRSVAGLAGAIDQDGHTWRLDGSSESWRDVESWRRVPVDPPLVCTGRVGQSRSIASPGCYAQPVLLAYGSSGGTKGRIEARIPGEAPATNSGGGFGYSELANGNPDAVVQVRGLGLAPGTKLVVGTYVLDD